jgi:hypothetical protein
MSWKDILKAPRDDNRRMIKAVIKYIRAEINEEAAPLSNLRIVHEGEFEEDDNADAKQIIISLRSDTGNFYSKENLSRISDAEAEKHFMRLKIVVPKKAGYDKDAKMPPLPPELLEMIGLPSRQKTKPDNRYAYDLQFVYEFFGDVKESDDLLEVLRDLKHVNDSRDIKDLT